MIEGGVEHIYVVGHSKGGAVVTITSLNLSLQFPHLNRSLIEVITFGSPGVGNSTFTNQFNQAIKHSTCFMTSRDPVAKLPPRTTHVTRALRLPCVKDVLTRSDDLFGCHKTEVYVNVLIILGDTGSLDSSSAFSLHRNHWLASLLPRLA
jgi:hypothetical protein